jgi:aspartate-semialdehyde dehydrogenase
MKNKILTGVLGATGSVGQRFISLLENHPYFEVIEVAASDRSEGKKYSEAVSWIQSSTIPKNVSNLIVKNCNDGFESQVLFSALDAGVAGEFESLHAANGHYVISNSKNHRFSKGVPLLIPEVNPEHLNLLDKNKRGGIITNPNCSAIGLVMALKPLFDNFGLEAVNVVTMQALSGAGYPGIASLDIIDNVIPFIGGEEEKIETEPLKILGTLHDNDIKPADFKMSAQVNRVNVIDGHLEAVQVKLKKKASREEIIESWNSFTSIPQKVHLPSAPLKPVYYFNEVNYPQPRLHRNIDKGMAVSIGRLRECSLFDYKFTILSHNTIRGAAGGAILTAELMKVKGFFNY